MKKTVLAVIVCLLCAWSGQPSHAVSPDVVISQVYGGGGNSGATYTHDFIELFNRGSSTVSLTGWSVQYASATGTGNFGATSTQITPLSGSIPAGGYLLVQEASTAAVGSPLPTPDVTDASPIAMSGSAGKVVVVSSAAGLGCNGGSTPCTAAQLAQIIDLVGYGGANFFEGSPTPALTNTTAAIRNNGGCTDTDNNANDFTAGTPTPRNASSPAAPCAVVADTAPSVASVFPADGATNVTAGANVTVTFSEPVNVTGAWYTLICSITGAKAATVSGGPTTFTIDPAADFVGGDSCTLTIVAANVTDQDVNDPPDVMAADVVVNFSVIDLCTAPFTTIPAIQGSGAAAAILGSVITRGVVVGDYEGPSPALRGFYIQDATGDGNPATSDGLFVFNANLNSVNLGDIVAVSGTAAEFQFQTQVTAASVAICGTGSTMTPADVWLPVTSASDLERYEGMLVHLPQTLFVTETFFLGRFGEVTVSSGGRLLQPTDVTSPGPLANALQAQNDLSRLIIDDGLNNQYPDPIAFGRGGLPLSASNTLRGGDMVTGTTGVMTYTWAGNSLSGNAYRVRPIGAQGGSVLFAEANSRPAGAPASTGTLRVASMNLLNFFNTFGSNACTFGLGRGVTACRGADNAAEFARQWVKTVAAILGAQADIVGIIEIENDGYGPTSAIQYLVDQLNAASAPGTYAFIDADTSTGQLNALGTDAIKVGIIYKPAKVIAVGQTAALNSVAFVNGGDTGPRNRPALAQAFEEFATGARLVVSVNHFKSKGTGCNAPDSGDGQGECNAVRVNAAIELAAWLAGDPTGTGDPDVLVMGDLNAYSREDPIVSLQQSGFANLLPLFGGGFSYVFDGQWGSLDHAMATSSLTSQVAGAWDWTINADEPEVLDYNTDNKAAGLLSALFSPDEFRMADHNPLIIDLNLDAATDTTADASAGAHVVLVNSAGAGAGDPGSHANLTVTAKFKRGEATPQGQLMVIVRRTESDGLHTYQIKASTLTSFVRDLSTGRATIVAEATIMDVTNPEAPVVIDVRARVRAIIDDNGEPGGNNDTIAVTVLDQNGALWFSTNWDGVKTLDQPIAGGNVKVR